MKKFFNWPLIATAMVIATLSTALSASADTPTALYIIGQVNQYTAVEWDPTVGVQMTYDETKKVYTADVYCQSATNDFSFATELDSWDVLNSDGGIRRYCSACSDYWRITTNIEGTSRFDTPIGLVHYDPSNNKKGSFRLDPGCYTINVDLRYASNPTVSVSRKAVTVTTFPRTETVKAGTEVTAQTNLDELVAATGSGETVTVQLKEGTGDWGSSVTLANRGLATVFAKATIGSLTVENAMAYNVRSVTALDQKTYTWTDEEGEKHTSSLTDVATNPKQIMALLNKVYTDPEIPGAKTHTEWSPDGKRQYEQIPDGKSGYSKYTYQQSQKTINYDRQARIKYNWNSGNQTATNINPIYASWIDCDKPVPDPNEEGATVLFVQVKDTWHADDIWKYYDGGAMTKVDYATRDYTIIKDAIESMQVITNQLRVTDEANNGTNPGNLFLIDNITTSRFYFISKGRVRAGTGSAPLYLAFEQLSPVQFDPREDMSDKLNSGGVYNFVHDCYDVFKGDKSAAYGNKYIPHYCQISGFDIDDRDNIEARVLQNLTLFLPDKRFKHPDSGSGDGFLYNYDNSGKENFTASPKMLLYKAQLAAEATPSAAEEGYYDIKIDWNSWFGADKIKADVKEQFYVYLIDDDGNKALLSDAIAANDDYHCDGTLANPTNERTYTYRVKQLKEQQNFTFIVIANPEGSEMFVKTNVARVVVPGNEKFFLDGAKYRSRYQLSEEKNVYQNTLRLSPNTDYNSINTEANFYEMYRTPQGGTPEKIATITFTRNGDSYDYTVNYVAATQDTELTYDTTAPVTSGTINRKGYIDVVDRFTASTANNDHPAGYSYILSSNGGNAEPSSNSYSVPVFKTNSAVALAGFTLEQINGDTGHKLAEDKEIQYHFEAQMDEDQRLNRYDVHRVHSDDYHTHIGRLRKVGANAMSIIGLNHATGNLAVDLGHIDDASTKSVVQVYDDLEYCPSKTPEYVTEIYTSATDIGGKMATGVENHYGSKIVQTQVPELEVTTENVTRTNKMLTPDLKQEVMGYRARLNFTPTVNTEKDTEVYFYRTWRVNDDGTETLLNTDGVDHEFDDNTVADYSILRDYWPGESKVAIDDIYQAAAIPDSYTETVTVDDYDAEGNYSGSKEEQVIVDGSKDVSYIVRMYSTREHITPGSGNLAPRAGARKAPRTRNQPSEDGKFYVTEKVVTVKYTNQTPTAIKVVNADDNAEVVSVKYYNIQGIAADRPFDGFNIKVETLSNGNTIATKFRK